MTHYIVTDAKKLIADKNMADMDQAALAVAAYLNSKDATNYEMYYGKKRFSVVEVQS